jgi:hypothetical protein
MLRGRTAQERLLVRFFARKFEREGREIPPVPSLTLRVNIDRLSPEGEPLYGGVLTRCIQFGLNRPHTNPTRQRGECRCGSPRWRVGLVRPVCNTSVPRCSSLFPAVRLSDSDIQPDGTHQCEGITMLDDSRAHAIVESHPSILEVVLEMDIHGRGCEVVDDPGQRQVMSCDQSDRTLSDQATDD